MRRFANPNTHKCLLPSCTREVDAASAFCPWHWQCLPPGYKDLCEGNRAKAAEQSLTQAIQFLQGNSK